MIVGFCAFDPEGDPPGKLQVQDVGVFVLRSVNATVLPAQTVVGVPENPAIGGLLHPILFTTNVFEFEQPEASVTVHV